MSVYTRVDCAELAVFLQDYPLGELVHHVGIEDGIENSNYLLTTTQGDFVLTLFECFNELELGYFLALLAHLQAAGFPSPQPQIDNKGRLLNRLATKPAAIFKRIAGSSISTPTVQNCQQVGTQLAQLHRCGEGFKIYRANGMDLNWCYQVTEKIRPRLKTADYGEIIAELEFQAKYSAIKLPHGLIHGDLFKDNVLFFKGRLTGILDFYNACEDSLLLDLAITANDWSYEQGGDLNREKLRSVIESYQAIRALTTQELELLPVLLRAGALRFWLSRLEHQLFPRDGELTQKKDPLLYRTILQQHQARENLPSF